MRLFKGRAALLAAAGVFVLFLSNVMLGSAGSTVLLGDVGEAVTLFIAVIFFVIGILRAEESGKRINR